MCNMLTEVEGRSEEVGGGVDGESVQPKAWQTCRGLQMVLQA